MSTKNDAPPVFVIAGESNSGGHGRNSEATAVEQAPRDCLQIMNLQDSELQFEPLHLGVNNLREHYGLDIHYDSRHGFENELANAVDAAVFGPERQAFAIKTGHGGSKIAEWHPDHSSGYRTEFVRRIEAGQRQLQEGSRWAVWYTQGLNDAIAGTDMTSWLAASRAHLEFIKSKLPGVVIVMTQFQSMRNADCKANLPEEEIAAKAELDAAIAELAASTEQVSCVDTSGASLCDHNHWDYQGHKTVVQRLIAATQAAWGRN